MLLNKLESYYSSGFKAGEAARRKDEGLRKSETEWFQRAIRLEDSQHHKTIKEYWNNGYKDGYGEIRVSYFK